ncbi:MAG: hypothetical protein M1819_007313 [Sarea resinae]|nr:MAG: hypothetical protein M1819_007313 [Sarea resinae]
MSPPLEVFPASELPFRVQATAQGKRRKQAIDLARCEPLELVQYACWLEGEERSRDARVICDPLGFGAGVLTFA